MGESVALSTDALRFAPVSASTSVFFDEGNRQVFTVRDNAAGIAVTSLAHHPDMRIS